MPSIVQVTTRRWLALAEGTALLVALGSAGLLAVVTSMVAGWQSAQSGLLGAGVVIVFFSLGVVLEAWALGRNRVSGLLVVLASFGLRMALIVDASLLLSQTSLMTSTSWFAIGAATATITWLAGLVIGHLRGRWPIYDLAMTAGGG